MVILNNCYLLYYPEAEIEDPRDNKWNYNIFMEKCLKKTGLINIYDLSGLSYRCLNFFIFLNS